MSQTVKSAEGEDFQKEERPHNPDSKLMRETGNLDWIKWDF